VRFGAACRVFADGRPQTGCGHRRQDAFKHASALPGATYREDATYPELTLRHPLNETVSQRHSGSDRYGAGAPTIASATGGAMVGRVGGTAEMMRMQKYLQLTAAGATRPNDVLNGPGYSKK